MSTVKISGEVDKILSENAKIYGVTKEEVAEKLMRTGSSRLGSLRKDAAKRAKANGTKPRKKAAAKPKKKVAKKTARKAAAKPKKKVAKKAGGKKRKSLADRARQAKGASALN